MSRRIFALIVGLLLLVACLAACGPEATPLPVNLPTLPAATVTAPAPDALRYAVAPDALPFLSAEDRRLISASAEIVPLDSPPAPDDFGTAYQIVVSLAQLPDSTPAPQPLQISLLINTSLPPLDDAEIEQIVRWAVDPQQIAQVMSIPPGQAGASPTLTTEALRADLANVGYPDGFDLTLAADIPAFSDVLVRQLAALGIQVRTVPSGEAAHLTLSATENPADSIPLLTIPITYRAAEGLTVTFTSSGFPIARR